MDAIVSFQYPQYLWNLINFNTITLSLFDDFVKISLSYSLLMAFSVAISNFSFNACGEIADMFFYESIVLYIGFKPYNLLLESDILGTKVFIDGEEAGEINENLIFEKDFILPGKHNIKLKYQGDYVTLEEEKEIVFFDEYDKQVYHSIYLNGEYISIDSNYSNAELYVNGKCIGGNIEDIDYLGPVPLDGSMIIQAKINTSDGVLESEEVAVDNNGYYYLEIIEKESPDDFYNAFGSVGIPVDDLIKGYVANLVHAINNNDFNLVKSYIEEGSPLYEKQQNLIKDLNDKDIKEELLDYKILSMGEVSDNKFEVKVYENHRIIYSDGSDKITEYEWIYTVAFIDDGLLLYDIR